MRVDFRRVRDDFFAGRRAVVFFGVALFFLLVFLVRALDRVFVPAFLVADFFRALRMAPAGGAARRAAAGEDVTGRSTAGAGACAGIGVEGSISGVGDGISMSPSI